ncbi:MAG: c-type cytochrome domain-containing protein, partial [Chthoniobacteraceae bacterium]
MKKPIALILSLLPATLAMAETDAERETMKFFENDVRPLLANRCYECHGEKKKKGSLRLDHISFITKGGDSGPALVAGKPDESLLVKAIRYADPD